MVELVHVNTALRAILFATLLIVYSVMYLKPALNQYAKKDKTIAQKRENITQPESPVLVLCPDPPFKKSYFRQFGKNKTTGAERFFWVVPPSWKMVENYNSTAMNIYMNMSYQLGLDWNIYLSVNQLQVGTHNYVDNLNTIRRIELIPIRTIFHGLCYKIKLSNPLPLNPDYLIFYVTSSIQGVDKLDKIDLMIAANDTWQGIVGNSWPYNKGQ